jgi:hypothetical protein
LTRSFDAHYLRSHHRPSSLLALIGDLRGDATAADIDFATCEIGQTNVSLTIRLGR